MPDINIIPDELEPTKMPKGFKAWLERQKRKIKKVDPKYEPGLKPGDSGARWKDSLYLGARRAGNVALHVLINGSWIAGTAVLKGVPLEQALTGAGLIALGVGTSATMGIEKAVKEKRKSQGKSWFQLFDLIIKIIKLIFTMFRKENKNEGDRTS